MMPEISLNILDIVQNSTRANATLVELYISVDTKNDCLSVIIKDDGCGMDEEQVRRVVDPFFTSRTTRKVGLGIPFYKLAAENAGGTFSIESNIGKGTIVKTTFQLSHIDRMPMGDITETVHNLVVYHPDTDFYYEYRYDENSFHLDTREFRQILGDVSFDNPDVSTYIREYLAENKLDVDGGNTF